MANSPDIWNAVNGLNQQGYEAAPTHQTQPGGYSNLEAVHAHMVRLTLFFPSFRGSPCSGVSRGQKLLSVSACRTLTRHTRYWLLTSAGVFRQCPPSIATTWHHAPLTTQTVRKISTFISFLAVYGVQYFTMPAVFVCFSLGEPQKYIRRVADRRHPGQSSCLSKCYISVPFSRLVSGCVVAQAVRLKRKKKNTLVQNFDVLAGFLLAADL